jgi:hypothetical protein
MREYTFGEVLSFTGASRSQGIHLTAKRIIAPDFGDSAGTGHHRRFSFYNLVEYALAADLARVGVESYAIGIVLRHLRWLIGDAKGLVSWIETVGTLKPKGRRALDPRLIRTELRAHDPFYAWLWSDTESDDAEQIALKETFRERVAAILRRHKTDVWAAFREIRALQRESPYVREGYELWRTFRNPSTRPMHFFFVAWPIDPVEFRQVTATGTEALAEAVWKFELVSTPERLAEQLTWPGGNVVSNLRGIVDDLEAATGETLENAERERMAEGARTDA